MKEYVLGFMLSEKGDYVALMKKNRPDWQAGKLNGVGGGIEDGEYPLNAMTREFKEETGVTHSDWLYSGRLNGQGYTVYVFHTYSDKVFDVTTTTDEEVATYRLKDLNKFDILPTALYLIALLKDITLINFELEYL